MLLKVSEEMLKQISGGGLEIAIDGFGDQTSDDEFGVPIYLEKHDGKVTLRVWADVNSEEPTHVIDLEGARITNRRSE